MNTAETKEILTISPEITILGSTGLVGSYVVQSLEDSGTEIQVLNRDKLDILSDGSFETPKGKVILNLAAYTDVDGAQKELGDKGGIAWRSNVEGVARLAKFAFENDLFLINIGTDYEFAGNSENPGPYSEESLEESPELLSWYGHTKAMGLTELKKSGARFAHIRISYPYADGANEKDFVRKLRNYINIGYPLFADQQITPTYIPDLCQAIEVIFRQQLTGIFHVASPSVTNPYEMGKIIADHVNKGSLSIYLKNNPEATPRPLFGGLDTAQTRERLGMEFK